MHPSVPDPHATARVAHGPRDVAGRSRGPVDAVVRLRAADDHRVSALPRGRRGFTMIEMTMVVGLIAVLATVAIFYYNSYQNKVRANQAAQQIAAMGASIQRYWDDNRAYPAALPDAGLTNTIDPWGRPYVYYNVDANGRGGARKDHSLNPINTDYDLYSLGPDGKTKPQISQKDSLDDIIRAGNGAYVGVATGF
jgi:general secretion pathway protein G